MEVHQHLTGLVDPSGNLHISSVFNIWSSASICTETFEGVCFCDFTWIHVGPMYFTAFLSAIGVSRISRNPRTVGVSLCFVVVTKSWSGRRTLSSSIEGLAFFMHFYPGTMTTRAESINSDLQRGLDRRLRHTQHWTQNRYYRNASG